MCGICGKVYFDPNRWVTEGELLPMADTLYHRGPDGGGVWINGIVGLAHRRLAIIDLREEANQPMSNEDRTVWVTFNGEIYNFLELRHELEGKGHVFRTNSDTEVIVHSYEEYGRGCVDRLRGMFAFAIWDIRSQTLFLARDRVGKKPLYYCVGPDRFVFGSEIKAILADGSLPIEPDPVSIDHFLALQYIPAPHTSFKGIRKLPAAHWLELRNGHIELGRYWKLHYVPKRRIVIEDAIAEFNWHMAEAVRMRMISDVPLGAFLSGGVDSSAVVGFMARENSQPVKTFCAGFDDAEFDERVYSRMVADHFGTHHQELVINPKVVDILPRLVWYYDEPFGDSSAVPSYLISELTRQHVTVVLNGDGGDENFAGYDRYITDRLARHVDCIPLGVRRWVNTLIQKLPVQWRRDGAMRKISRVLGVLAQDAGRRYAQWGAHFSPTERRNLYSEYFLDAMADSDPEGLFVQIFEATDADDYTDAALDADVSLYLADDLLVKMDRATMAHSLEARSPFLDHVLMEFVATLPPQFKLSGQKKKHLLKESLRGAVPDCVLDRPKMGFCVPLARWFREDLREMAFDLLLSTRTVQRGYFRATHVEELLQEHCRGQRDHAAQLWDLLVLELWHRTFIDAAPTESGYFQSFMRKNPAVSTVGK